MVLLGGWRVGRGSPFVDMDGGGDVGGAGKESAYGMA